MAEHSSADVSPTFAALRRAALAGARYVDDGDVVWSVYELPAVRYDRRTTPTLIFDHDMAMHRVRDFPASWRDLPDAELLALVK